MLKRRAPAVESVNDKDIPVSRLSFNKDTMKHSVVVTKRAYHFIKGPIPFDWMQNAASLPGKTLAIALSLWYLKGLKGALTFSVTSKAVGLADCSRQAYSRGLNSLVLAGLIEVDQQAGRRPVITLKAIEGDKQHA